MGREGPYPERKNNQLSAACRDHLGWPQLAWNPDLSAISQLSSCESASLLCSHPFRALPGSRESRAWHLPVFICTRIQIILHIHIIADPLVPASPPCQAFAPVPSASLPGLGPALWAQHLFPIRPQSLRTGVSVVGGQCCPCLVMARRVTGIYPSASCRLPICPFPPHLTPSGTQCRRRSGAETLSCRARALGVGRTPTRPPRAPWRWARRHYYPVPPCTSRHKCHGSPWHGAPCLSSETKLAKTLILVSQPPEP